MIIYGPKSADHDIDLGPVLLTDYYHKSYYDIVEEVMGTNISRVAPRSVNNLINGKMDYNCSLVTDGTPCTNNAGLSKFHFTTRKKHRLRLINAGAEGIQKFSTLPFYAISLISSVLRLKEKTSSIVLTKAWFPFR